MGKRWFMVLLLLIIWKPLVVQAYSPSMMPQFAIDEAEVAVVEEENTDNEQGERMTAKEAHDQRQKMAYVVLGIIFVVAIACFGAVGWIMRKSKK